MFWEIFSLRTLGPLKYQSGIVWMTQPTWVLLVNTCVRLWPRFTHLIMATSSTTVHHITKHKLSQTGSKNMTIDIHWSPHSAELNPIEHIWIFRFLAKTLQIKLRCIAYAVCIDYLVISLKPDCSPPVANLFHWTWFKKAHTCLYKVSQFTVCEVQGSPCRPLWLNWVET